jgi:hypothetical protein
MCPERVRKAALDDSVFGCAVRNVTGNKLAVSGNRVKGSDKLSQRKQLHETEELNPIDLRAHH